MQQGGDFYTVEDSPDPSTVIQVFQVLASPEPAALFVAALMQGGGL
jgi:hypothetical protein